MKINLTDLAIFGGNPAFATPRHVNKPNAPDRAAFDALLDQAWEASWFTNDGPLHQRFEAELSAYLGGVECVLVANGTLGLELVVRTLGLSGEVIVPAFTFISTPHVLHLSGIRPRFCDINACDMNIDCDAVARLITDKTSAVIPTHIWGQACDTDKLSRLCTDAGVALIYDAAHAFGSTHQGQRIGGFGDAEVFSLHATKAMHSFEGGLITTRNTDLAADLRMMRNFGFASWDVVLMPGTNAKMSEIHAAGGLANLAQLDATMAASQRCHAAYAKGLQGIAGLQMFTPANPQATNYHYVVAELDADVFGLSRDALIEVLRHENVLARRYYYPGAHRSEPYRSEKFRFSRKLPVTDAVCEQILVLPAGATVQPEDVVTICGLIRLVQENAAAVIGKHV